MSHADMHSDAPHTPADFLVVGIGASAGGIEAIQEFFTHVPADSGIAYVVILHLSPDHDSQLAAIVQAVTPIPVAKVTEAMLVEPNRVYIVSPNQHLMMSDGIVATSPNTQIEERRAPVDIFFRTLAESHQGRAVCVVLSGTGANGSMGLKRVKERGGAVFVQNPREAAFNEMPRNAIATDLVDDVLPVATIPARIITYQANPGTIGIPEEPEQRPEAQQKALREVFTQLRVRTGHDFSNYKRPTLLRRIERRINVHGLPDLPAYAAYLQASPDEVLALLKDVLISVTNFFRDKAAFAALEQDVLPRIFAGKRADEPLRIWVAGCATGEEAYSIAMLCAERVFDTLEAPSVQIFATDINEAALAHAREGLYTINDLADVSPERLRRFFTSDVQGYRVRREIREMVLFANHNVLKDPPFSHLDLVSCRNTLIYLNHTAQERVMETLHFALNPGGYLFLGSAEAVDSANDLFISVSREHHIFQSRHTSAPSFPIPEQGPALRIEQPRVVGPPAPGERPHDRVNYGDLHQRLLEQYAPPSVVINHNYDIVHLSERAGRYLQIGGGEPSNNLLSLIRPELRLALRSALYQAQQRRINVDAAHLSIRIDERTEVITIHVRPVLREGDGAQGFILVLFTPSTDTPINAEQVLRSDEPATRQLEDEVQRLRQQLRTSSEQYEFQAEELRATNEELQALNEELRSSTEELETSKEELQSINEELRTVNQELKVKVEEATLHSTNMQNLVNSTDIGTIFLDRSFRIRLFTPAARALFNLIPADYGRPLSDITHRLIDADVLADAERVLATLQAIEREVRTTANQVFLLRVLPYRAAEDRIGGVIVTFLDISERAHAEEALRASEVRQSAIRETMAEGVVTLDLENRFVDVNAASERILGVPRTELIGQSASAPPFRRLSLDGTPKEETPTLSEVAAGGERVFHDDYIIERRDGSRVVISRNITALRDKHGVCIGFISTITDITARKQAEAAVQRANEELEERVTARTAELERLSTTRQELLQRLVTAQEDERRRIAHELHDSLGQFLSALTLELARLQSVEGAPPDARTSLARLHPIAAELDVELDRLTLELRPPALDDLGLDEALGRYAREWSDTSGIAVEVLATGFGAGRLPLAVEATAYRIVQEALTNVRKHAQASHVSVIVERKAAQLRVIVEDDGVGFDPEAVARERSGGRQLGLVGISERASLAGGSVAIESEPGNGTAIYLLIPLSHPD